MFTKKPKSSHQEAPTRVQLNKAFTLAEVLITLGIIGVVAAMTIPTLLNNIEIAHYRSALKKEYSMLSQAISILAQDLSVDTSSTDNFINALSTQIKMQKIGDWGSLTSLPANYNYKCYKEASGACGNGDGVSLIRRPSADGMKAFITNNGVIFLISAVFPNCDGQNYHAKINSSETLPQSNSCTSIFVDINGDKNPNQIGMDLHYIYLLKKNNTYYVRPSGANYNTECYKGYPENYNLSLHCTTRMLLDMPMP